MTTPTREAITNTLYGDAIRALRDPRHVFYTCVHSRPELKERQLLSANVM